MRSRSVPALLLLASLATAQYTVGPAAGSFTPLAGTPGAFQMTQHATCEYCTVNVPLPFPFPWFGTQRTSVGFAADGGLVMDGTMPAFSSPFTTGPQALQSTVPQRIAVAQADLDPETSGTTWYRLNPTSAVFSWENVEFYFGSIFGPPVALVNAQVEIFASGSIEIRYGVSNGNGFGFFEDFASGISHPQQQYSPQSVLPMFLADGITNGSHPINTGVRFDPVAPVAFQTNSSSATLRINGVEGTPVSPAVTTVCTGETASLTTSSTVANTGYEIGVALGPALPGVVTTPNGQIINLDVANLSFLFGGAVPFFAPIAPLTLGVSAPVPVTASAQMIVLDVANPDGFSFSQAGQLDVVSGASGASQAGPVADDEALQVFFTTGGNCGPAVPFCGTTYTSCFISSNGRVSFGAGDADPSPTVAEALSDPAFFGYWTDLAPNQTGSGPITWNVTSTTLTVNYSNVEYWFQNINTSLTLSIDAAGVCTIDVSGLNPNAPIPPGPFGTPGGFDDDAAFLGLSCGNGAATDPGTTAFSPGGSGVAASPTDMLYDFADNPAINAAGGLVPSVTSLQAGSGLLIFTPGGGGYSWQGL